MPSNTLADATSPLIGVAEYIKQARLQEPMAALEKQGGIIYTPSPSGRPPDPAARQLLGTYLYMATIEGATEIRFEPEDERFGVYMRIGDTVYEMQPPSKQILQALVECIRELAGTGPGERTGPKPGAFPFRIGNSSYHPTVEVSSTESGARAVVSFVPVSAASGR